jgi:hypothetical protein
MERRRKVQILEARLKKWVRSGVFKELKMLMLIT